MTSIMKIVDHTVDHGWTRALQGEMYFKFTAHTEVRYGYSARMIMNRYTIGCGT